MLHRIVTGRSFFRSLVETTAQVVAFLTGERLHQQVAQIDTPRTVQPVLRKAVDALIVIEIAGAVFP